MENLQDFIVSIDPLKRNRRLREYGKYYTNNLLKKVSKQNGIIILAYEQDRVIGCIVGVIEEQSKDDVLGCIPTKAGRVLELFVSEEYRHCGVGSKLMKKVGDYFKHKKCDITRIEVFEPNKSAYNFYKKLGYSDRIIDLIKKI